MSADLPTTYNFLSPANFQFSIMKLPVFSYFVQKVTVPEIMLQDIKTGTTFRKLQIPGNPLDYGKLTVEYKLDENMDTYSSVVSWLQGLGIPDNFGTYANLVAQPIGNNKFSDCELIIQDSQKNPKISIHMTDCFPTSAGGFTLDSQIPPSALNFVTSQVTFNFQSYSITKIIP